MIRQSAVLMIGQAHMAACSIQSIDLAGTSTRLRIVCRECVCDDQLLWNYFPVR